MRDNLESEKIVHAILGLTKSLGLPTVAEGMEDAELRRLMVEGGCELGQGFYFRKADARAKPVGPPLRACCPTARASRPTR